MTLNRYAYCGGNPIIYIDPSGHSYDDYWKYEKNSAKNRSPEANFDLAAAAGKSAQASAKAAGSIKIPTTQCTDNSGLLLKGILGSVFGASTSAVSSKDVGKSIVYSSRLGVSMKTGAKSNITTGTAGDSTKPISVFTELNTVPEESVSGFKFNSGSTTIIQGWGKDNLQQQYSITFGNTKYSVGDSINFDENHFAKEVEFQFSATTVTGDYSEIEKYTHVTIDAELIAALWGMKQLMNRVSTNGVPQGDFPSAKLFPST